MGLLDSASTVAPFPIHRPHRPLGKLGLDPDQASLLERGLRSFDWPSDLPPPPCDTVRLARVLRTLGCHIAVLARPRYWNLTVREEPWTAADRENGTTRPTARWERTKTRARCRVPLTEDVRPWMARFVDELPELEGARYERESKKTHEAIEPIDLAAQPYQRAIRILGRAIGLPDLVPMTFRHTWFVDWLLMTMGNVSFVSRCSGTSERTVLGYAKRLGFDCPPEIAEGTWKRRYGAVAFEADAALADDFVTG